MALEVVLAAAELAAKYYGQKKAAADSAAQIAQLLRDNNKVLVAEFAQMLKAQFSAAKLDEANNQLDSLVVFAHEVANNPDDASKIEEIDLTSQYVIDKLNDDDISFPGLPSYIVAASLRIQILKVKSFASPGELQNAKDAAKTYRDYVLEVRAGIESQFNTRFKDIGCQPQVGVVHEGQDGQPTTTHKAGWHVCKILIDDALSQYNSFPGVSTADPAYESKFAADLDACHQKALAAMSEAKSKKWGELVASHISKIDAAADQWSAFAAS